MLFPPLIAGSLRSLVLAHSPSVNVNEMASGWNLRCKHPFLNEFYRSGSGFQNSRLGLLALAIGMGLLGWAYWPNLQVPLHGRWEEPNYSHGFLVIPIALVIFWLATG